MNESITRAAGALHGEELPPAEMESLISSIGRQPAQRTTLYEDVAADRRATSFAAAPLVAPILPPAHQATNERAGPRALSRRHASAALRREFRHRMNAKN